MINKWKIVFYPSFIGDYSVVCRSGENERILIQGSGKKKHCHINQIHRIYKIVLYFFELNCTFVPPFSFFSFLSKFKKMNHESQPLLGNSRDGESAPTFWSSTKVSFTNSYFNLLLIFVPIALIFSIVGASDTVVFTLNFIAIIPLAKMLGFGKNKIK